MAVFLKILAIIGIILLSILGIIILALILVLFVPVRYKAEGAFKDNKPSLVAKASWLLHIVSVRYTLGENEPVLIRIFGIRLKTAGGNNSEEDYDDDFESYVPTRADIKKESVEVKPAITSKPVEEISVAKEQVVTEELPKIPDASDPLDEGKDEVTSNVESEVHTEPKSEEPKKDFENRSFYDKIKKYIEIIDSRRFKKTFEYCKNKVYKLLKYICPRKICIDGEVGFDDPSVTGQILVITSMLKPILGKNVRVVGNFEEPVISIEGSIKGRITIFRVLWTGAVLYFNKNIRKIIKMFREV